MKFRKLENMSEEKKKKLMNFLCVDHLPLTAKDYAFYAFLFFLVVIFSLIYVINSLLFIIAKIESTLAYCQSLSIMTNIGQTKLGK